MARKWTDGDSARLMTIKYNETADQVNEVKKSSEGVNSATQKKFDELQKEVDSKLESVTAEDLGLGNVDNTHDMDKPVSTAQAKAIDTAVEPMLTSEPTSEIEGEVGFISSIQVVGTKLIIGK